MTTSQTALRLQLKAAGFSPLPLYGKEPPAYGKNNKHGGLAGWQDLHASDAQIHQWDKTWPDSTGTGILTAETPALDIDIMHREAAEAVENLARERFGEDGDFLVRIGKPPKRAILMRTRKPFPKILRTLLAPDGTPHRIEVLGAGQQIVCFGTHPETGGPYTWHGGQPGGVGRDQLPEVSASDMKAFVDDAAEVLIVEHGFKDATEPKPNGGERHRKTDTKWGELNERALQNLSAWVPKLFPTAQCTRRGGYRVASADLGRGFEEDLSFTPAGIKYFGVADMGDLRQGRRTPIDIVIEWQHIEFAEAAEWLDKTLANGHDKDVPPDGCHPGGYHDEEHQGRARAPVIKATPFVWIDPTTIPPRQFLYGKHLIRQFVSTTFAHGGVGKSSLEIAEALAMTSNKPLLGIKPQGKLRCWYWNGEDPLDEIHRRVMATVLHYKLTAEEIGALYIDVGRLMPIIIAEQTRDGAKVMDPIVDAVIKTIQEEKIDVMIIDPFVSSHRVTENDNNAIEIVAKKWAHIADVTNSAIELSHHSRKTGSADVSVQDGRGAVALLAAARSARVLNTMSEAEAAQADVHNRKYYFRVDNGKANLSVPIDKAQWYQFVSVNLCNDVDLGGDDVGVPVSWNLPNAFDGIKTSDLRAAQKAVSEGGPWREDARAYDWVGRPIAAALKLNPDNKRDKRKITSMLKTWIENGMFVRVPGKDPKRRVNKMFVEVGQWAN
jgi:hypothetical protein